MPLPPLRSHSPERYLARLQPDLRLDIQLVARFH